MVIYWKRSEWCGDIKLIVIVILHINEQDDHVDGVVMDDAEVIINPVV